MCRGRTRSFESDKVCRRYGRIVVKRDLPLNIMKSMRNIKKVLMVRTSFVLLIVGSVLLVSGLSYFIYSWKAHSELDSLTVSSSEKPFPHDQSLVNKRNDADFRDNTETGSTDINNDNYADIVQAELIYPGEILNPALWRNPFLSDSRSPEEAELMKEFTQWSTDVQSHLTPHGVPVKLTINSINLDSQIVQLGIINVGDSRSYETPKDIVGHIPETSNPGGLGSMWLFGHLESPIRGEGNIFSRLPEIPDWLREGRPVYALVDSENASYLYRITKTLTVHQDDLRIEDIPGSSIVMVTCVPRIVYDYRLLVMGEVIGVKTRYIE